MGRIGIPKNRAEKRVRRHLRVRKTVQGTAARPRLVVFRSLKHITAQLVDDGIIRSTVTQTIDDFSANGLREAHKAVESGRMVGKIVVRR